MSSTIIIQVQIDGMDAAAAAVQRLRNALARRGPLHAKMAKDVQKFTQDYLSEDTHHKTATALGAAPTGHRAQSGKGIEADSNDAAAILRIPTSTGLGRAFHDVVIVMRQKMLTIAASAKTYGKSARDFPEDPFEFATIELPAGRFPALVWKGTKDVAYWLARKTHQKQDRTLLPSDEGYQVAAARSASVYLTNILRQLPA